MLEASALKTDPLARTPRSRPRAGGGWAEPLPSREGVGDGWGSLQRKTVNQLPGPPYDDPPTSPLTPLTGPCGGSAVGRLAHALPPRRAAQHSAADRDITSSGGPAADVTPSAATGAAVEPLRGTSPAFAPISDSEEPIDGHRQGSEMRVLPLAPLGDVSPGCSGLVWTMPTGRLPHEPPEFARRRPAH